MTLPSHAKTFGNVAVADGVMLKPIFDGIIELQRPQIEPGFVNPAEEAVIDVNGPVSDRSLGYAQLSGKSLFGEKM